MTQVTLSPTFTVTVAGEKLKSSIRTEPGAAFTAIGFGFSGSAFGSGSGAVGAGAAGSGA